MFIDCEQQWENCNLLLLWLEYNYKLNTKIIEQFLNFSIGIYTSYSNGTNFLSFGAWTKISCIT
jgi:hypothetical protein